MKRSILQITLFVGLLMITAACQPTVTLTVPPTDDSPLLQAITPIPTLALRPTETHEALNTLNTSVIQISASTSTSTPEIIPSPFPETLVPTEIPPSATAVPIVAIQVLATEMPSNTEVVLSAPTAMTPLPRVDHYLFERPFPRNDTLLDYIDRTYPYGSTQNGAREVHLGVDYANTRHTRILAIGAGTVIFAGTDEETLIGPVNDYYGNTVIVKHDELSPEGAPVYTLYGHMETIDVEQGQVMTLGDRVGTVGDTGIAIGPHLHLEVRVGGDGLDYRTTRNPDLWIKPYPGYGTIAGRVTSQSGIPLYGQLVLIRTSNRTRETYTYGERANGDAVWQENFTLGDLPAGEYEVLISDNGNVRFRETVSVHKERTAFVEIVLDR